MLELSPNVKGRDFVCGDIHGCYSDLEEELAKVNFNKDVDRLFTVGDLADRGPESKKALGYINFPWFQSVIGNHEDMFLQCWVSKEAPVEWHYRNGGKWVTELTEQEIYDYATRISNLPLIIKIGSVLICHSLLPHIDLDRLNERLSDYREFILWQRDIDFLGGPNGYITYAGHTINDEVTKYGNVVDIDTGAFLKYWKGYKGKLTLIEIGRGSK
jgi:serine/threonine protein phosphatase 1